MGRDVEIGSQESHRGPREAIFNETHPVIGNR